MKNIETRLREWREIRKLTQESQVDNLLPNVLEELTEYARAKTNYDKIDALCDICVFCLNSGDYSYKNIEIEEAMNRDIDVSVKVILLLEEFFNGYKDSLSVIVNLCLSSIKNFTDKEPIECLRETIKEIESRTGKYIEEKGKFVKDIGSYSYDEARSMLKDKYGEDIIALGETEYKWIFNANGKICEITKWYKADYNV